MNSINPDTTTNEEASIDQNQVVKLRKYDVIKGRGNGANLHPGNVSFRQLVNSHKDAYYVSSNDEKKKIILRIIQLVQGSDPPGRFLCEEQGIWKLMDHHFVLRKVGQALREQQNRSRDADNMDKPPRVIDIASNMGPLNKNSKRGRDDFFCDIRNAHKLPKIGENTHKAQTQQYQIGVVKEEMKLLREQILLLGKRVAFLEQNVKHFDGKKPIENNRNISDAAPRSPMNTPNSSNYRANIPSGSTPSSNRSLLKKPSLRSFSQALASSIQGITRFDNAEDVLFAVLTHFGRSNGTTTK